MYHRIEAYNLSFQIHMVTTSTEELVMKTALKHINKVHIKKPEEISPELKAKMKASIKPEQGTLWFRKAEAYIIPNDTNSIILLDNEITFLWVTSGYLPFL
jgi:predicted small metal-binding protein